MLNLNLKVPKLLNAGSIIKVKDNSGVKQVKLLTFVGYKGVKNRLGKGGVGSICKVSARVADPDKKGKMFFALIIQQKRAIRRAGGERIQFADNACVLLTNDKKLLAKKVTGIFPRELIKIVQELSKQKLRI
jgi:large subunit ribosomal protein L14